MLKFILVFKVDGIDNEKLKMTSILFTADTLIFYDDIS